MVVPSNKLIEAVLGYVPHKVTYISYQISTGNTLLFENEDGTVRAYWNIHELLHRCKLWAYDKNYLITEDAYQVLVTDTGETLFEVCWHDVPYKHEATLEVCEWILKDIKGLK
jgi:hypothetical protein